MKKQVIVLTGCDANFFPFMEECLESLLAQNIDQKADIGILDFGLSPEQVASLKARGYAVLIPSWTIPVPEDQKVPYKVGFVARTALRDYFPGYQVYLWFDADAWAQTPEFFIQLVEGAKSSGAGIVREDGLGYSRNFLYNKWWYGHLVAAYGIRGFKVAWKPAINIGILALADTAPHWDAWIRHYTFMIEKRQKINMDQHAFCAAVELENLPVSKVPARCNWIATLSPPRWDGNVRLFCEPEKGGLPLSVVHLAGPDKKRVYPLDQVETALTYPAFRKLQN